MLTKYTLDLNDEDLTKQSIELRKRFAGRKLNENIQNGVINDRILIKMKDMNRHERIEHGKEVHHIMKTIQDNRTTIVRSEQQLIIQNKLSSLKNDIARSTRLNKSKVNTLVDLENRIIKLRQNLNEPQPLPNVEHVMIDQLTNNNKSNHKIQELFQQCNICNRKVLNDFYQQHYNACVKMNGSSTTTTTSSGNNTHDIPIYDVDINLKTSLTTFQPQPPRNCNLCNKGYRYISFTWESPVFDGGLPITNYEINYKTYTVTLDPHTKMKIVKVKEQPIISTSQWFYKNPICHNGFKLTGLDAGQSYVDFRIRSVNLRGVSDWIDLIPADGPNIITTLPPVAPWEPLFVHISKVTSTCIYLDWEPPLFDGGCEIVQYEIKYTVHHKTITSTNRLHVTPKEYTLKTSDTSTK